MNDADFARFCADFDVAFVVLSRDRADVLARYTDRLASGYTLIWSGDGYSEREYRCKERIEAPRDTPHGRPGLMNWVFREFSENVVIIMDDDAKSAYWMAADRVVPLDTSGFLTMLVNLTINALDAGVGQFGISEADIRYTSPLAPFNLRHAVTGAFTGTIGRGLWLDERQWTRNDHDFALQQLKEHRISWTDNRYVVTHDLKSLRGGMMEFRTREREQREIARLQQWWGKDVITVAKDDDSRVTVRVPG